MKSSKSLDIDAELDIDTSILKASPLATGFNIVKTIVGAGIFVTPYALNASGMYFGMGLVIILGFVFYWTIMTMVRASHHSDTGTAQELLRHCFGVWGERGLNFIVFMLGFGSIAAYTVIIGDVLPDALVTYFGVPDSYALKFLISRRGIVLLSTIFVLLPISMAKSMSGLAKFSGLAVGAIIFIIAAILAVCPTLSDAEKGPQGPIEAFKPMGIQTAISYVCHHSLLINYHQMKNTSIKSFGNVTKVALGLTCILTVAIGFAYITFREKSKTNILNSFPKDNLIMNICRILFAVDLLLTYPLGLYVTRDTVEKAVFSGKKFSMNRHVLITIALLAATAILGCVTCDLGIIVEITGGIGASLLAYYIPGACWMKVNQIKGTPLPLRQKIPHWISMFFGICLLALTCYSTVHNQINNTDVKECGWV